MKEPPGLKSDEKRDASASIAGYVYQIYQSILAWINLNENEFLFLEGAEDFDILSESTAEATQVKNRSKNITMRSTEVVDALNNFWDHRSQNPQNQIQFRFLSNAECGLERDIDIPDRNGGIDYWIESVKNPSLDIQPLKKLLLDLNISDDLKQFVEISSEDEFRKELLTKFNWYLGAKPLDGLKVSIEESLINHGNRLGILPRDSSSALDFLVNQTLDRITSNNKSPLKKIDFLLAFEKATTTQISVSHLHQLRSGSSTQINTPNLQLVFNNPMPIVNGSSSRQELVQTQSKLLKSEHILFIHGSSGLGKTNLTSQIAMNIQGNWNLSGLRGRAPDEVRRILKLAYVGIQEKLVDPLFIIDDLNFSELRLFEQEFIALVFLIRELQGHLLITGPYPPPASLAPKLWLSENIVLEMPYMDEMEISDAILKNNLPDKNLAKGWAKVIKLFSQGHPQLVHARIRSLSLNGWKALTNEELLSSQDFEEIRKDFRKSLTDELHSEDARRFLYRLSIVSDSFSRKSAMKIADCSPAIELPGEVFTQLIGPWIEDEGDGKYKISPLLSGAATATLSDAEIKEVRSTLAFSVIEQGPLNQLDILFALNHAILAESSGAVMLLSMAIIDLKNEPLQNFAFVGDVITQMGSEGKKLLPSEPAVEVVFRLAQFKIIVAKGNNVEALKLISTITELIDNIDEETPKRAIQVFAYGVILNQIEVSLSPKITIPMILELKRLPSLLEATSEGKEIADILLSNQPEFIKVGDNHFAQILFSYEQARIDGVGHLKEIIDTLSGLSEEDREFLLRAFESDDDFAGNLVGRAWVKEINKEEYDTNNLIEVLDSTINATRGWHCNELLIAAVIAKSIILDERMSDQKQALQSIEDELEKFPNDIFLLNQKSIILFHQGDYVEASKIFDAIWENNNLPEITNLFMLRLAGINASNLNDFGKAAKFFSYAAQIITSGPNPQPWAIGFHADAALSLWEEGDGEKSLLKFKDVVHALENITVTDNLYARHLFAVVGNAITWVYFETSKTELHKGSDVVSKPIIGMSSNPDPNKDIIKYDTRDTQTLWEILSYTEQNLQLSLGISEMYESFAISPTVAFDGLQRMLLLSQCWKSGTFSQIISWTVSFLESLAYQKTLKDKKGFVAKREIIPSLPSQFWDDPKNLEPILLRILGASLVLSTRKPEESLPLDQWILDAKNSGVATQYFIEFTEVLNGRKPIKEAYQLVAASIFYLRQNNLMPIELWQAYFGLLNIFAHWHGEEGEIEINNALDILVVKHWLFVAKSPSFLISNPRDICPKIITLCNYKTLSGISKTASILELTVPALKLKLIGDSWEILRKAKEHRL